MRAVFRQAYTLEFVIDLASGWIDPKIFVRGY